MGFIDIHVSGLSTDQYDHIKKELHSLRETLFINNQKLDLIMATFAEVQQALTDLQASIDTKQAAIAQAIADLEAKIAAGAATPEELQTIVDGLKAAKDDVDSTPTV